MIFAAFSAANIFNLNIYSSGTDDAVISVT